MARIRKAIIRKAIIYLMCALFVLSMSFTFFGCNGNSTEEEDKKYDVAIRVGCSDGNIYEFPIGTDELRIEIPYDGTERTYWVDSYNLPGHPRYSDVWFDPTGEGANVFGLSIAKEGAGEVKSICEQGTYCINIYADSTSKLWNFREILLFVSVTTETDELNMGSNDISVAGKTEQTFCITSNEGGFYSLVIADSNVSVCEGATALADGSYLLFLEKGKKNYLTFANGSANDIDCEVTILQLPEMTLGEMVDYSEGIYAARFKNTADVTARYIMQVHGLAGSLNNALIYNKKGDVEGSYSLEDSLPTYTFALGANEECYIVFNFSADCSPIIMADESNWGWVIAADGENEQDAFTIENIVYLERGATYKVYLCQMNGDGEFIKSDAHYVISFDYPEYASYDADSNELTIDNEMPTETSDGMEIHIFFAPQPRGYSLTIVIAKDT